MKTLSDLNSALFAEIERLQDKSLSSDGMDAEIKRAEAVGKIANTIINSGNLELRAVQHFNEYGYGNRKVDNKDLAPVPALLSSKDE